MDYLIIPFNNDYLKIIGDINVSNISETTNVYCCSLKLICKLETMNNFPLKNKYMAIINILDFLKYVDIKMSIKDTSCISINQKIFSKFFTRDRYNDYIKLLNELDIMSLVPYEDGNFYQRPIKDSKTKGRPNMYRLHTSYVKDDNCLVIFNNKNYGSLSIEGKHNPKVVDTIKNVTVDYKSAIKAELDNFEIQKNITSIRLRLSRLFALNGDRYIKYGTKSNRVYNSLSNISKISREFLSIKGKSFFNLDIKNCQPLLLCYLLKMNNMPIDDSYIKVCQQGMFYENFYENTDNKVINKQRRSDVKELLYKGIFFAFKKTAINLRFKELFPLTYTSLSTFHLEENLDTLASLLQNIEADIFNNLEPDSKYYYTLFDAIYFTDIKDKDKLTLDILNRFDKYNLIPSIDFNGDNETIE